MSLNHLPLSRDTRAVFQDFDGKANNPGLIFDRYICYWEDWTLEPKRRMEPPNPKLDTLKRVAGTPCDVRLLAALSKRQEQLFRSCNAKAFEAHPDWRFITGLGGHSPLEVGFTFHRVYGIPIIAGSSLKGLTLAYAKYGLHVEDGELELIFGSQERAGAAIFFDALPIGLPQLELDVMNPHYPDWYQKQEAPANWQNPIPVFFLTVGKETWFRFAVGSRGKDGEAAKVKACDWLKAALREMGAGAKTSAGYGYFSESEAAAAPPQKTAPMAVGSEAQKMTAQHRGKPASGKTGRLAAPRPEQEKAAAEAKKEADKFLRQTEKKQKSQAGARQTAYQNNAVEEVKILRIAPETFEVALKKLPEQHFTVKKKNAYRNYQANTKIRVRILVNNKGEITRVEEV
jgi:CRISPR-associated protein Cmr6